uniref:Uncharacterized protein n=1 Tax=Arundo donax TaxID=35708 RepID=A0A0A9FE28_ARUDO
MLLIFSISLPYMLCQVCLQATMRETIMNTGVYLEHPSELIYWPLMIFEQRRSMLLVIVKIIASPIRIPLVLYNHVMQYNARIHDLRKCFPLPHTCWVTYYSKTSLQYTKSTFHIFSCSFLFLGK